MSRDTTKPLAKRSSCACARAFLLFFLLYSFREMKSRLDKAFGDIFSQEVWEFQSGNMVVVFTKRRCLDY